MANASPVCALPCPVIFDLDGTLIDSVPDLAAAVNRLLAAEDEAPMTDAEVASYVGNGAPVLMRRVMEARGFDMGRHDVLTAQMVADYTAHSGERTTLYPGVLDALEILAGRGHALGLCTNKPIVPTRAILRHFGLDRLFAAVIGGDSLPERKPHPLPLLHAAQTLGVGIADCVYVGDDQRDIEAARAAGMRSVVALWGYRLPGERPAEWGGDALAEVAADLLDPLRWP